MSCILTAHLYLLPLSRYRSTPRYSIHHIINSSHRVLSYPVASQGCVTRDGNRRDKKLLQHMTSFYLFSFPRKFSLITGKFQWPLKNYLIFKTFPMTLFSPSHRKVYLFTKNNFSKATPLHPAPSRRHCFCRQPSLCGWHPTRHFLLSNLFSHLNRTLTIVAKRMASSLPERIHLFMIQLDQPPRPTRSYSTPTLGPYSALLWPRH